jgi:hypothetical protein
MVAAVTDPDGNVLGLLEDGERRPHSAPSDGRCRGGGTA